MRNAAAKKATTPDASSATMTLSLRYVVGESPTTLPVPCAAMERCNSGWVEKMPNAVVNVRTTPRRISASARPCILCVQGHRMILTRVSVVDQSGTRVHMVLCENVVPTTLMTRPYLSVYGERKLHQGTTSLLTNEDSALTIYDDCHVA